MALTVIAIAFAVSCGPGATDVDDAGSDNVPGENTQGTVWVSGVPLYPQAETVSGRTEKNGVVTQSFMTDRVGPERLIQWYERELVRDGWATVTKARPIGKNTYRGDWIKERSELRVTATPGPELDELRGVDRATQFSLTFDPGS